jgi:NAD+ synthetase
LQTKIDILNIWAIITGAMKKFSLNYENELGRIYEALVGGVREYFSKNGFKKAVLGLSGGLDSAVNAALLADALGAHNVYALFMPSSITSSASNDDALELAQNLKINYLKVPVSGVIDEFKALSSGVFSEMSKNWNEAPEGKITAENLQARIRATLLWQCANAFSRTIPIATSDKSEFYIGYTTINGDMSGGLAPLANVTKTKVRALARFLNIAPESIITKPSGPELELNPETEKFTTADETNGPEAFRDEIIWRIENPQGSDSFEGEFLAEKMATGEFEPSNIYEQDAYNQLKNFIKCHYGAHPHPISPCDKKKWLEHFFSNAQKAAFKRSIAPPSITIPEEA